MLQLDQSGFGMSGRDYYLDPKLQKMRDAYMKLVKDIVMLFSATDADATAFAEMVLRLETDLANVTTFS